MSESGLQIVSADGAFGGYLSLPKDGAGGPGMIIAQEIFGVNAFLRDIADGMADHGFVTFVPDLFWRIEPGIELTDKTETEWKRAFELFNLFNVDKGIDDIQDSITALRGHPQCNGKVGVMGFCLGGLLATLTAARTDVDAAISYYGVGQENKLDEIKGITTPLLMHIAEEDSYVDKDAQAQIKAAVADNPHITVHSYPGREHAFARFGGEHFHEQDAHLAAKRGFDFLKTHILREETA